MKRKIGPLFEKANGVKQKIKVKSKAGQQKTRRFIVKCHENAVHRSL
jgi:hypothetical protein